MGGECAAGALVDSWTRRPSANDARTMDRRRQITKLVSARARKDAKATWKMASFEEPETIPGTLACPVVEAPAKAPKVRQERRWLTALRRF
jgi:hypothetical protein